MGCFNNEIGVYLGISFDNLYLRGYTEDKYEGEIMLFKKTPSVSWSEIDKGAKIIDVREPIEYKQGHAKGAKNVPLSHIETFKTDEKVFVVCASGNRSKRAVKHLRKEGIDAINIKGGMATYGK